MDPYRFFQPDLGFYRDIVEKLIVEYTPKQHRVLDFVDKYSIGKYLEVYIVREGGFLKYVVVEPPYDHDTIYTVAWLIRENPFCKDTDCLLETIRNSRNKRVIETYSEQSISINYYYRKILDGYGFIHPLIQDPDIEEIACNAEDGNVAVLHRRFNWYGWMKTNIEVGSDAVDKLVLMLSRKVGKHISISYPLVEGLTQEGLRISLAFRNEVSRKGSSIVIRKKPRSMWTITKLIDNGTLNPLIASYLWIVLENRGFIIVTGSMGSGKTTLLQSLLTLIPPTRRVVSIEDTPEIMGSTGLWDPLVEREGVGDSLKIDAYTLLKFILRRRADYIVVGEVRGVEARVLIQASRLGHGVLTTIHAQDAGSVIERLSSPPISIPKNLLSNITCIVVMENIKGVRRVREVVEVDDNLELNVLFNYDDNSGFKLSTAEEIVEKSVKLGKLVVNNPIEEIEARALFLSRAVSKGVFETSALCEELVHFYYGELIGDNEKTS
ncbi:MAG: type II/IV secretion system ATPase subunit [Desulfurococcaceae archaeon]